MQKNEDTLDYLIEDVKNHLTVSGSKPTTFTHSCHALTLPRVWREAEMEGR
jgi:hypothetical protein